VLVDALILDPETFASRTGWEAKPEGACLGERCVPLPAREDGRVDVEDFANRVGRPIVHDEKHGLWALGPEGGGRFLESAVCPEIVLPDLDGNPFRLSSLHGRKVLLIAWASW
jgi:hypothetical protein